MLPRAKSSPQAVLMPMATLAIVIATIGACSAPVESNKPTSPLAPLSPLPPPATFDGGGLPVLPSGSGTCPPKQPASIQLKPWQPPHALHQNVCTPEEAVALVTCFLQGQNCEKQVSRKCHQCTITAPTDPVAGPIIVASQEDIEINIEGCIAAMAGDTSANGCGPKTQAIYACQSAACGDCPDDEGYFTCLESSEKSVCASQATAAQCGTQFIDTCIKGESELEVAFNLVKVFCGP